MTSAERVEVLSSRVFPVPRSALFEAFADPDKLARWWGPHGFTNTINRFELRPGGEWHMVMRNSDGADFDNRSTFEVVREQEEIRFFHHGPIHAFTMIMTYAEADDGARLTWRMLFERTPEMLSLKKFIAAANEQNFDRLAAFLGLEEEISHDR